MVSPNEIAKKFSNFHIPGNPVILTNVYDGCTAKALLQTDAKAAATASFAIAESLGLKDDDLTFEQNLAAIEIVARVIGDKIPISADIQDGYGSRLEEIIAKLIELGVVGCNLEDAIPNTNSLLSIDEATLRVKRAREVTKNLNVPDFVINARTDVLIKGGSLEEAIRRGREYLAAGATTVFVWGGGARGVSSEEVRELVKAFDGKLNVKLSAKAGALSVQELKNIGVSRISCGPELMKKAMANFQHNVQTVLEGVNLELSPLFI
ncbi:hypothetical protein HK096_001301, partial [Nowakowskiella sp. JEL0078]